MEFRKRGRSNKTLSTPIDPMSPEFVDAFPDFFNQENVIRLCPIFSKHPIDFPIELRQNQITGKVDDHAMRVFLQSGTLPAEIRIEFSQPADAAVFISHGTNQCPGILIADFICFHPQGILVQIFLRQLSGQRRKLIRSEFLPEPCKDLPHGFSGNCPGRNTAVQRKSVVRIVFQNRFCFRIVSA